MMFEYQLSNEFGLKCLHLKGRIESMSASEIQREIGELILSGERRFIIDFEGVNYISSSGLRVFLVAQKQLSKAGGEIILFKIPPDVLRVFKMSGFEQLFHIASSEEEIQSALQAGRPAVEASSCEIEGIQVQFLQREVEEGKLFVIGSQESLETSDYTEKDVKAVKPEDIKFGTGLAAIGDRYEDYKDFFGEAVVINKHLFFYPAAKRSAVDFMLYTQGDSSLEYKFLHGFGFKGDYKYILSFESPEGFIELSRLFKIFFTLSEAHILGVVFMAESRGLWGMNLKRIPLIENKPKSGKSIFDSVNFSEWMNFPVEPSDMNNIIIGTGIAVKDRNALSAGTKPLIPGEQNFHLHACVFEKQPFNKNLQEFDKEMNRVLTELEVYKVQHILGQTRFSSGIVGLIELKE
jgi:anti-anti-sigma factor